MVNRAVRTRGQYVDYEIEARLHGQPTPTTAAEKRQRNAEVQRITKESIRAWNRLTAPRRQRFVEVMNAMKNAFQGHEAMVRDADDMDRDISKKLRGDPHTIEWESVLPECLWMKDLYRDSLELQAGLVRNYATLANKVYIVYDDLAVRGRADRELKRQRELFRHFEDRMNFFQNVINDPDLPQRGDGKGKIAERHLPPWKKFRVDPHMADRELARFADSYDPAVLGDEWEGAWPTRRGGMGTTGLWILFNTDDTVKDRVFRKEVYRTRLDWMNATMWVGDVHDAVKRRPIEIVCHELYNIQFRQAKDAVNVPRLRDWHVNNKVFRYTMYLDYHSYGDLDRLIANHRGHGRIPEPFLWRVFHSLSKVGFAMEVGYVDSDLEKPNQWKEIVHRDLKPSQVFLGEPTDRFFEVYATPVLGDFGLAIKTTLQDPLNPGVFVDFGGTPLYMAPEQNSNVDFHTLEPLDNFKLSSKTNVWGIGLIMFLCATRKHYLKKQPLWLGDGGEDDPNHPDEKEIHGYSNELRELIDRCLRFNPDDRPTFRDILREVDQIIQERYNNGDFEPPDGYEDQFMLDTGEDRYAVGLARDELPPLPRR